MVFGQAPGCLGTHVIVDHRTGGCKSCACITQSRGRARGGSSSTSAHGVVHAVVGVPPGLSAEAAATVPTVFLTADACLNEAVVLAPGQRVLIHAAAGGLGLAALQVVAAAGAVALGTAGSSSKRAFLRSTTSVGDVVGSRTTGSRSHRAQHLKLRHCPSSEHLLPPPSPPSADFACEAMELSKGAGVDVVLNSLTSAGMVAASLACVGRGGAFVEVGKNGIWSAARVAQVRGSGRGELGRVCSAWGLCAQTHSRMGVRRSALMCCSTRWPLTLCLRRSSALAWRALLPCWPRVRPS